MWPGHPVTAHWGIADPAAVQGTDMQKRLAFKGALTALSRRIDLFLALPVEKLEKLALEKRLAEIGALA